MPGSPVFSIVLERLVGIGATALNLSRSSGLGLRQQAHHLADPAATLLVLQVHQDLVGPVNVEGKKCYLPAEQFRGVAHDSPGMGGGTSKPCWQCGQTMRLKRPFVPSPLIWL